MNTLQNAYNDLAEKNPAIGNLAKTEGQKPVSISQPIDTGAERLLRDYRNAWLTYPPLEVEYLVQTLNEHLANCLELRMKAQELEIRAFSEASDQLLQRNLLETLRKQAELFAKHEPQLLGNTVGAKLEADHTVSGKDSVYWTDLLTEQENQIDFKYKDADTKLARLNEAGNGSNYVARFEFLKKTFETDLIEAYCRARAAAVGLKAIYDIVTPVPEITDTGYLDKLVLWARSITYDLEKKFFSVRETTVAFALNDGTMNAAAPGAYDPPRIMTLENFRIARNGGAFTFTIPDTYFNRPHLKLKNPRLKGVDISIVSAANPSPMQFWRILVKPPEKKIPIATGVQPYAYAPSVFIPMATYLAHASDLTVVPNQREVNNVSPIGEWTIRIEPKSVFGTPDTNVTPNDVVENLLIRMRIAYDKE